ncbi:hypothetical protein IQ231_17055 [Cuspidothrix issatschenkoi LEGE 03284]|nr:hypothetical protein [Cuspidothrix issatschenkoi LEGE 03284]
MLPYQPTTDHHYETVVMEKLEDINQQDWIAEPDIAQQTQVNLEFQQLLKLNTELRTANNDLYAQIDQLKTELAEAEKILHWQKTRSSVTESMFNQQTQELAAAQEQIKSLYGQLETSVQTVQRQELSLETYKSHLQISQQRLAHLERECSLLQTNYTEESQQLLNSENTCRELRSRLMRQQRQTLQFKAALEKCLDTSIPNHENLEDHIHHPQDIIHKQTRFSRKARSLFPHAQPIRPWSADTGSVSDSVTNSTIPTPDNYNHHPEASTIPPLEVPQPTTESIKGDNFELSPLDEQLEGIIHKFFQTQSTSVNPQEETAKVNFPSVDSRVLETLPSGTDDHIPTEITITPDLQIAIDPYGITENAQHEDLTLFLNQELSVNSSSLKDQTHSLEDEDYWLDPVPVVEPNLPMNDFLSPSSDENTFDHKSPSPLIYPQRPPKGRKSLASVELPNFRPKNK